MGDRSGAGAGAGGWREGPGGRGGVGRRPVTVDSSKARTSLRALRAGITALHWREFPGGRRFPCDIYWHGVSFLDSPRPHSGQVNKFPGMLETVRKITFSRAMRLLQRLFPEEYNFYPRSWVLPEEYHSFIAQGRAAREKDPSRRTTFIVKPDGGSQGDGIYLVREAEDGRLGVSLRGKPAVVQEYISRPLLMDKLKFDIRLYVLLKSLQPLEIYIAKDGLSRFCTEPYQEPSSKNIHQLFMHLTNYSLNIHSGNFIHSDNVNTGSKRSFSSVLARLSLKGCDVKKVWSDIISLVIKTIVALVPELKVYHQANIPPARPGPSCFQILGFDILLMKNMKPVLLEVNANPSMRIDHEQEVAPGVFEAVPSPVDEDVKVAMIRDTLRLVDPDLKRNVHNRSATGGKSGEEEEEEEIWEDGEAEASTEHNLPPICLKQVFPKYAKQFSYLLVVEHVAALFIRFLGIKGTMKLGPTGFRTFIRNCKLCNSNLTMASADILYIDITRRWNLVGGERGEPGMCLQAFMDAFLYLAERKYRSLPLCAQVQALVDFCEAQLEATEEKRLGSVCGAAEPTTHHPEGGHSNPAARSPTNTAPASPLPTARDRHFVNPLNSQGIS